MASATARMVLRVSMLTSCHQPGKELIIKSGISNCCRLMYHRRMFCYNPNKTAPLPPTLSQAADHRWNAVIQAATDQGVDLPRDAAFSASLHQVMAFSEFIAKSCVKNPAMPADLYHSGDLTNAYGPDDYDLKLSSLLSQTPADQKNDSTAVERKQQLAMLQRILRHFRRREMTRIAWRDLAGWADLEETMQDLSTFADVCINRTIQRLYQLQCQDNGTPVGADGAPQQLIVVGMGKLGGRELNFSSDIDLIFAYPRKGKTDHSARPVSNDEFFVRLCRNLLKTLSENTPDGHVFRVDMRLRPDGDNGPLVMNFDNMEEYYQVLGREWERYAWIKARIVAGETSAAKELMGRLKPFIFRRYLDYSVFESLRNMKQKIALEVQRKRLQDNIKLGPGGIREIEFFGQIFQLLRGGVNPLLQERRILGVLQTLAKDGTIDPSTCDTLSNAYCFLRCVEHRLQEFADQQTHELPKDETGKSRLAHAMGFQSWESFEHRLETHRKAVQVQFNTLLEPGDQKPPPKAKTAALETVALFWLDSGYKESALKDLAHRGIDDPEEMLRQLMQFKNSPKTRALSQTGRERIDRLIPMLITAVMSSPSPATVLKRVLSLIESIQRRTTYIALLLENPNALEHLIRLAGASPWIVSFLTRHPVLLDELIDPRTLYAPPQRKNLQEDLQRRLQSIQPEELEYQMEELCIFKQINMLRVAAADITHILPLMKVSDYLCDIAETILAAAVEISWNHLTARHGTPQSRLNQQPCEKGFAVIAYGKLGGLELGYKSDLDVVFIHCGVPGQTTGKHPIENSQFFARLGQRVIHTLSTYTAAGKIYEIDMRLRPSGSAGIIVSHFASFEEYQAQKAWTWEHQALLRTRAIIGDTQMTRWFNQTRKEILTRCRDRKTLREAVCNMREKMRGALLKTGSDTFDMKQDRGGIVDIEFLVQYLVLLHAHQFPELVTYSDNVRQIQALAEAGILEETLAHSLRRAYLVYRAVIHRLNLREQSAKIPGNSFARLRSFVRSMWKTFIAN